MVNAIDSMLSKVQRHDLSHDAICLELTGLKDTIDSLRRHLQSSTPGTISQTHVPNAKDELDAVVQSTEAATNTIMTACENVLEQIKDAPADIAKGIEADIVRIYEACTFQDITGQRITKVIKTLKQIDGKVCDLLEAMGASGDAAAPDDQRPHDDSLLNGPQMTQDAISQDEIDRLLADF